MYFSTLELLTYDECPGQVDPGRHVSLVLQHLHSGTGLEHHHHVGLVEDHAGRVHCHSLEVLDLLRVSVEVNVPPYMWKT